MVDFDLDEPFKRLKWHHQDNGATERGLCRSLKGGVPVGNDLMSAAAMMRDARRELREFEAGQRSF